MIELGSFQVGTGGLLVKDPRSVVTDEQVLIADARPGWWNAFLQKDGDLICALVLIHDGIDPQKTRPEWQDSIGSVSLVDDSIGVFNQTKFEAHCEEILPDFGTLMTEEAGYCLDKYGAMAVAGVNTASCDVFTDTDKKSRVVAVKVVFWDDKESWGEDPEEDDEDENPSEFGWGGERYQDGDEPDDE